MKQFVVLFAAMALCALSVLATAQSEIPLPEGAIGRFVLENPWGWINSIAYSPDGEMIAVGTNFGVGVELRDAETLELTASLAPRYPGDVWSVAFSPDGETLALGTDHTIELWDVASGVFVRTLKDPGEFSLGAHNGRVQSLTFSPDGDTLASGGHNTIKLWDAASGALIRTLTGHEHSVYSAPFSPNGEMLASGSRDGTIRLWDVASGELLSMVTWYTGSVYSVAFSPNGETLASGGVLSHSVKLWDVSSTELLRTLSGHTDNVTSVAFSPDGETVASGSADHTIRLWDVSSGEILHTLTGHTDSVKSVAYSPNGEVLASGSLDNTVLIWSIKSSIVPQQPPHAAFTWAAVNMHGERLVVEPRIEARILFDSSESYDPDGEIAAWHWDFGDGTTSTEKSPLHQYSSKGTYAVALTVTDDDGLTASTVKPLAIANSPPQASYGWEKAAQDAARLLVEPRMGDRIVFDASASSDSDGDIVEYAWDWTSDGTFDDVSVDPFAEYWFKEPGAHDVTLRVTDDEGATATHTETISIVSAPEIIVPHDVWALVVGISDYAEVNDLTYARADAEAFARWLLDSGVPTDHIRLLLDAAGTWPELDGLSSELATLTKMRAKLEWLRRMAQPEDLVFVFFAGHGYQGTDDDGDETTDGADEFLVLYDAEKSALEVTTLRDDEFGVFLDRIESNHVMVVFDSCYSGGQSRSLSGGTRPVGDDFDIFSDFSLEGKLVLAAAREDQEALEHEAFGHGVFTHFLLRGLDGQADADSDYLITAEELYAYVSTEVERFAREAKGHKQEPEMTGRGEVGIVVSRTNRPPRASFDIEPEIPYAYGETRFEDTSTDDTEIVSWFWDLGDGATSTEARLSHIYEEAGTYTVSLTVTDAEGTASTIGQAIAIAPPGRVTLVSGETIIISLGTAHAARVGDRFDVIRVLRLSDGTALKEHKATLEIEEVLDADRARCRILGELSPIETGDRLTPVQSDQAG